VVQLVNTLLEDLCCNRERGEELNIGFERPQRTVDVAAQTQEIGSDEHNPAGTYYIRVTTDGNGDDGLALELSVEVTGVSSR
jgi:hypothetical protein